MENINMNIINVSTRAISAVGYDSYSLRMTTKFKFMLILKRKRGQALKKKEGSSLESGQIENVCTESKKFFVKCPCSRPHFFPCLLSHREKAVIGTMNALTVHAIVHTIKP